MSELVLIISVLCVLLIFIFYFSGSETALFSLDSHKIKIYKNSKEPRKRLIYKLLSSPDKLLISILIGYTPFTVLTVTIFEKLTSRISEYYFPNNLLYKKIGLGISIFVMTFILLVFGEIMPKYIAVAINEKFSLFSAPIINIFYVIVTPIREVMLFFLNIIRRILKIKPDESEKLFKEEDIKTAIEISHGAGEIDKNEIYLFKNIFEFENFIVKDITIPKKSLFMLEENRTLKSLIEELRFRHFSRIITYKKDTNSVSGIIYLNQINIIDVQNTVIKDLKKKIIFVPELMHLSKLLIKFIENDIDTAAVVDEYGAFVGIVTLEDMLEKIVGQVNIKHILNHNYISQLSDNEYLLNGYCDLAVFNSKFNTKFSDGYSSTIGGFVTSKFGKIPNAEEKLRLKKFEFTITKSSAKHIEEMKVKLL